MSSWQEIDDIQLLNIAQSGDTEAFGELYERYAGRVFRFLYAHMDNRLDAEDLTEDVFLRVWKSLSGYREQGVPFLAFLFRIARNALIDHYRRSGGSKRDVALEDLPLRDHSPGPVETVMNNLEHQELRQTLERLREDYRTVLVLRFLGELSPEETAQAMGRTSGAVRVMQHRALAALRSLMEGA
ncbi:MAG TPA: RNA polymerase sigma factor [Anaerolineales bacterium]|nr:RNA polymerase sigma factor [Anaerolineales bacterium]